MQSGSSTMMSAKSSDSTEIRIRWERRAVKEVAALQGGDRERVVSAVEDLRIDAKTVLLDALHGVAIPRQQQRGRRDHL